MYNSQNKILLSKKKLLQNYNYLSSFNPTINIAPVLKSNAYGYGIQEVASILDDQKAPFFCVNSFAEACGLLDNKITTSLLITGYVDPANIQDKKYPFSYAIYNFKQLEIIQAHQPHAELHIFVDTGMHREGIRVEKLEEFLTYLKQFSQAKITGVMSHFAQGDKPESELTKRQIADFSKARKIIKDFGYAPKWEHIAASSGILTYASNKNVDIGNLARVGKALYGIDPRGKNQKLQPILTLTSKVVQIKKLKKGDPIGYDETFHASDDMTVGVLPIGYYDGVDRRLSNKGVVLVDRMPCPIVGRVSMNITTVDISEVENPHVDMEVVVFSDRIDDPNSIEQAAKVCDTIPYDIAVRFPTSMPRIVA